MSTSLAEALIQLQSAQYEQLIAGGSTASFSIPREVINNLLEAGVEVVGKLRGIRFDVVSIQVVRLNNGPDRITFNFEGPHNFPDYGAASERPDFSMECKRGYAQEYLKLLGIPESVPVEVIDATREWTPFSKA